jgi:transposase-like protein
MERRKFTREFKLEAVRLIKDRGTSRKPLVVISAVLAPTRSLMSG